MQKSRYGIRAGSILKFIFLLLVSGALGYYVAAGMEPGFLIFDWMAKLQNEVLVYPFRNYWNEYSLPCMMVAFFIFSLIAMYYMTATKNYMHGREYGTAHFIDASVLNQELADLSTDVNDEKNIVLSYKKGWFGKIIYELERK